MTNGSGVRVPYEGIYNRDGFETSLLIKSHKFQYVD